MDLLIVENEVAKPQDNPGSEEKSDLHDFKGKYFIVFFFSLENKLDFQDVIELQKEKEKFDKLNCNVVGVTSESPFAIRRYMEKSVESGSGFGGLVQFPIISDKDMSIAMKCGVGVGHGKPAKSSIIFDKTGKVRHISVMKSELKWSTKEMARLVAAYQKSDSGLTLKANWTEGMEGGIIPNDFEGKKRYYEKTYGTSESHKQSDLSKEVKPVKEEVKEDIKEEPSN